MGLFQIASLRHPLGASLPDHDAYQVTGRTSLQVDRIQARISVEPKADGTLPDEALIRALERSVRFKLSLDRNDTRMVTVGEISVASLFAEVGPIIMQPFKLNRGEECKVKVNIHPNLYNAGIFKDYPAAYLEILFFGQEV